MASFNSFGLFSYRLGASRHHLPIRLPLSSWLNRGKNHGSFSLSFEPLHSLLFTLLLFFKSHLFLLALFPFLFLDLLQLLLFLLALFSFFFLVVFQLLLLLLLRLSFLGLFLLQFLLFLLPLFSFLFLVFRLWFLVLAHYFFLL